MLLFCQLFTSNLLFAICSFPPPHLLLSVLDGNCDFFLLLIYAQLRLLVSFWAHTNVHPVFLLQELFFLSVFFGRRFISTASEHVTCYSRCNKLFLKKKKKTHQRFYKFCCFRRCKKQNRMECSLMTDLLRINDWPEFKEGIHWLTTVAFG